MAQHLEYGAHATSPACELRSKVKSGLLEVVTGVRAAAYLQSLSHILMTQSAAELMKMLGWKEFHWRVYTGVLCASKVFM